MLNSADPVKDGYRVQPDVAVRRLDLQRFRSYADVSLNLDGRSVVFTGPNGAGKTNLLEAVSMLAPGRGLRGADLKTMAKAEKGGDFVEVSSFLWALSAVLKTGEDEHRLGTAAEMGAQGVCRRVVRIDGESAKGPSALGHLVRMNWLTPAMDRLFVEGKSARRRFLDRLVLAFDPHHASAVTAYDKALRDRQRLLKEGRNDDAWFVALEETMAKYGVVLAKARCDLVRLLSDALETKSPSAFPKAGIALEGNLEAALEAKDAGEAKDPSEIEAEFAAALKEGRRRDREAGRTLLGPHRSDLLVRHRDKDMPAHLCSTGEKKALLISIFLTHARLLQQENENVRAILLLDEVAAHLDEGRRAALFDEVEDLGCQAWMTGTDQSLFAPLQGRAQFFSVEEARIWPAS